MSTQDKTSPTRYKGIMVSSTFKDLEQSRALLERLGEPIPDLPPYDPAKAENAAKKAAKKV